MRNKNQNTGVNNETDSQNLFDAFESMMYHELMNNLNFIAFPVETMQHDDSMKLSRFSGIQMLSFLQTTRYIKMFEKGELQEQAAALLPLDPARLAAEKLEAVTSRRHQRFSFGYSSETAVLADMQLTDLFWFNLLGIAVKFAPDNSEIIVQASASGKHVGYVISFQESPYTTMPAGLNCDTFASAMLQNSGFERTLAVKLLYCNIVLKPHGSELSVISNNQATQIYFRMNAHEASTFSDNNLVISEEIPDPGLPGKQKSLPLLQTMKDTPFYKLSALHSLAGQIEQACGNKAGNTISTSLHALIDNGNHENLLDYINLLTEAFQS